jgi:hypothetical protein
MAIALITARYHKPYCSLIPFTSFIQIHPFKKVTAIPIKIGKRKDNFLIPDYSVENKKIY